MNKLMIMTGAAAMCFATPSAQCQVRSSVFDDVKVWYKGSAGNASGTSDAGTPPIASGDYRNKMKSMPQMSDASSTMHGGYYDWWGWRFQYANQNVDCPYAGVSLTSVPCIVVPEPEYEYGTGTVQVEINGEMTTQPYYLGARYGSFSFKNWMSDWASSTVCSNYTAVLRFRSDTVNPVSGNANQVISIGGIYNNTVGRATGVSLCLNTPVTLGDYACPRIWVGTDQQNYTDCQIKSGRWVDCAIAVNGATLNLWLCWNNGTDEAPENKLVKLTKTYTAGWPTIAGGCSVALASASNTYRHSYTNGVYNSDMSQKVFRGAFHQIAFWERTLSDDEIREAMAGGTCRPNLVQVGIEGNGIDEFATSTQTASVSNTGAWENLNPTLTAANPTATIAFTCPALLAGKPQYLRVPMAATSTVGELSVALNGETLGALTVNPGKSALLYVPESKIASGDNTLVLTRTNGDSLVLDAVALGGSWQFGESISSFSNGPNTADKYIFNPSGGNDKFHDRTLNNSDAGAATEFRFYVPADLVGRYRGVFTTRAQNTGGGTYDFEFVANGTTLGTYGLKGGNNYAIKVPDKNIVAGWNTFAWKRVSGWVNIDWHKFEVKPPPKGMIISVY